MEKVRMRRYLMTAVLLFVAIGCVPGITAPSQYDIEIGEVTSRDADLVKVLSVDHLELPNCDGTGELTITRSFSKSIPQIPDFSATTSFANIEVNIPVDQVMSAILDHYNLQEETTVTSESYDITVTAPPGTKVGYEIQWLLVSKSGVVEITVTDKETGNREIKYHEFYIPASLEARVQPPVQEACDEN